jgi:hypothetical protein
MYALMRQRANVPIVTVVQEDSNLVVGFEQFYQTTTLSSIMRTCWGARFAFSTSLRLPVWVGAPRETGNLQNLPIT